MHLVRKKIIIRPCMDNFHMNWGGEQDIMPGTSAMRNLTLEATISPTTAKN